MGQTALLPLPTCCWARDDGETSPSPLMGSIMFFNSLSIGMEGRGRVYSGDGGYHTQYKGVGEGEPRILLGHPVGEGELWP